MAKRSRKSKKMNNKAIISIIAVVIIAIVLSIGLFTGKLSSEDFTALLSSLLNGAPETSSPSPSPTDNESFEGNTLLIGNELTGATLNIHFIDVGQGDSIYIEFPDGKNMLIDGGDTSTAAKSAVLNYLNSESVTTIDIVMLTHTDADHVGSLDDVVETYEVKNFYIPDLIASDGMENENSVPGSISTTAFYDFIESAENEEHSGTIDAVINYNIGIIEIEEELYTMTFYCPELEYYDDITNNSSAAAKNNMSPIVVIEYSGRVIILTGDADEEAEQRFVDDITAAIDADVLKVAHHGGGESSNDFFLDATDPEYAIISCGEDNSYHHPRQEAIDRLLAQGVEYLFRTDINSDITLLIDSGGNMLFTVETYASQESLTDGFTEEEID